MRVIKVRCAVVLAEAVAGVVDGHKQVEQEWWRSRRVELQARRAEMSAAERSAAADALQAQFEAARERGELRGTRTAAVLPALREVMGERGWLGRAWKPVPPVRRGRPWGTHDSGFGAQIVLQLPDELGETLVRACHWASAPAVARLQAWYEQHGDHWRGQRHDPHARWLGAGPSHADLTARDRLTGQIYTTGRVCRTALEIVARDGGKVYT